MQQQVDTEVIEALEQLNLSDPRVRRYIVEEYGFVGFTWVYLPHHFNLEPADFHPELVEALDDPLEELIEIIGFRGSAKSTYASLAYPLYLGLEGLSPFIILGGDTTTQTKLNIQNIQYELENNPLIIKDYGIAYDENKNWSTSNLLLKNGTLIMGRSRGQKMRGLKHRQYRPHTVIIDDPEDLEWVKKKDNRDKTARWFKSEVIPAQQEDSSKLILIGNLLHKDALMMRIKKETRGDGRPLFRCFEFALIDANGKCTWEGKYPTEEAIKKQKEKVGSPTAWAREYLLKIVAEEDQVIKEEDIHYYPNALPDKRDQNGKLMHTPIDAGVGVDLAISEKEKADYTAMVGGKKYRLEVMSTEGEEGGRPVTREHILIMPNPVNERMGYAATLEKAKKVNAPMPYGSKWFVEDTQYQKAALQGMKREGLAVFPMRPINDKKARLETVSPFIKDGTVLFPEHGCEELIEQLVGFGTEEHDDLVDALVYLIMGIVERRTVRKIGKIDKI